MNLLFLLLMKVKDSFYFRILSIFHFKIIQFFYCFLIQTFNHLIECINFKLKSIDLRFMICCQLIYIDKFLQRLICFFTFIQYKLVDFRHLFIRWLFKVCLFGCCFMLKFINFILEFIYHFLSLFMFILWIFRFLFTCIYFFLVILQSQIKVSILIAD